MKNNQAFLEQNLLDEALLKRVSRRVAVYKVKKENAEKDSFNEESNFQQHVKSLTQVFGVPKEKVESLGYEALVEQNNELSFKDKIYQALSTYPKEFSLLFLVISIVFLLNLSINRASSIVNKNGELHIPEHVLNDIEIMKLNSDFTEVVNFTNTIKYKLNDYRNKNGNYSGSLSALGMKTENLYSNKFKEVKLGINGEIFVYLNESFGKNIKVVMTPIDSVTKGDEIINEWNEARVPEAFFGERIKRKNQENRSTQWKCETNFEYGVGWCNYKKFI